MFISILNRHYTTKNYKQQFYFTEFFQISFLFLRKTKNFLPLMLPISIRFPHDAPSNHLLSHLYLNSTVNLYFSPVGSSATV